MENEGKDQKPASNSNLADHLANERTFLAWVRTSMGIMAFGFVVEKFALFMKQIALVLAKENTPLILHHPAVQSYSSIFGIFLVGLGTLICLLSFVKFKRIEKQIEEGSYHPTILVDLILTLSVLLIGMFLAIYLNNSV